MGHLGNVAGGTESRNTGDRLYLFGLHVPGIQVPDRRDHLHRIPGLVQQGVETGWEGEVRPAVGVEGEVVWNILHKLHPEKQAVEIFRFPGATKATT